MYLEGSGYIISGSPQLFEFYQFDHKEKSIYGMQDKGFAFLCSPGFTFSGNFYFRFLTTLQEMMHFVNLE